MDPIHPIAPGPPPLPRQLRPVERPERISRDRDRPAREQPRRRREREQPSHAEPEDGGDGDGPHVDVRA